MWLWIGFYYYIWILNSAHFILSSYFCRRDWIIWKMGKVSSDCVYDFVLRYTLSMNVLEISFLNMIGTLFEQVHHGVLNFWRYHSCLAFFLWFWCSCLLYLFILDLCVRCILYSFWGATFSFSFLNWRGHIESFWLMYTCYVLHDDVSVLFLFINNCFQ